MPKVRMDGTQIPVNSARSTSPLNQKNADSASDSSAAVRIRASDNLNMGNLLWRGQDAFDRAIGQDRSGLEESDGSQHQSADRERRGRSQPFDAEHFDQAGNAGYQARRNPEQEAGGDRDTDNADEAPHTLQARRFANSRMIVHSLELRDRGRRTLTSRHERRVNGVKSTPSKRKH